MKYLKEYKETKVYPYEIIDCILKDWDFLNNVLAQERFIEGYKEYGTLSFDKTPVQLDVEIKQEIADIINYLKIKKINGLSSKKL